MWHNLGDVGPLQSIFSAVYIKVQCDDFLQIIQINFFYNFFYNLVNLQQGDRVALFIIV